MSLLGKDTKRKMSLSKMDKKQNITLQNAKCHFLKTTKRKMSLSKKHDF